MNSSVLSDEERRAMLESFAGVNSKTVVFDGGSFSALFRREARLMGPGGQIEQTAPTLVCLEADARRLELDKDVVLSIEGEGDFRVRRRGDQDDGLGPGFTRLYLRR